MTGNRDQSLASGRALNTFLQSLRDAFAGNVLAEKWVIAPSLRMGREWLDAVTRAGGVVLNAHVKTLRTLALDLAAPEMDRRELTFLRGRRAEVLVGGLLARLETSSGGYLSALSASPGLARTLRSALRDLRLAGLTSEQLPESAFEVESKGAQMAALLTAYENDLRQRKFADDAVILGLACERLKADPSALPEGVLILAPDDQPLTGGERRLWDAIPAPHRSMLPVDFSGPPAGDGLTDIELLRCLANPADAPAPTGDRSARIFRAVGEVNEIREILRRCAEDGLALDEVEIIHTDAETYVPLVFELACRLARDTEVPRPATFAEGIPVRYFAPGRALSAWLSWIAEDFPQKTLVRMVHDGLLHVEQRGKKTLSFSRLAGVLRTVPIGAGQERCLDVIDRELEAARRRVKRTTPDEQDDRSSANVRWERQRHVAALVALRDLLAALMAGVPRHDARRQDVLACAASFLETRVRCTNQDDENSRQRLLAEIRELADALDDDADVAGLDVNDWLAQLPAQLRVGGQGPRPGCLYVTNLFSGGHSGRPHTFIVGLDDSRFPGAGLQDPLLLDGERNRLSDELPTAAGRLAGKVADFHRLLARLRGDVTLSYCSRDLADDRELFPAGVVLAAFRILSGNPEGDLAALARWVDAPASFAPDDPDRCIEETGWWLWRLCGGDPVCDVDNVIAEHFAHLGRGMHARRERESDRFTEYDGYVPQAGKDLDPTRENGPVLSAARLETLGKCPMDYFFRYVLEITPPETLDVDPNVWLDPMQRGCLLHEVFRTFMADLRRKDLLPDFERDFDTLSGLLDRRIERYTSLFPPPGPMVFELACRRLRQTARIFLMEEQAFCAQSVPAFLEASVGLPPESEGTLLDAADPAEIPLSVRGRIRVRGKIDRVDRIAGGKAPRFTIWDYKTGSSARYNQEDPFRQGRFVQGALYMELVRQRLREKVSPDAVVDSFGYFFPNENEHGERLSWTSDQLEAGPEVIDRLCGMLAAGCFPLSDDSDDMSSRYNDYRNVIGDALAASKTVTAMMDNPENHALDPFRRLRA